MKFDNYKKSLNEDYEYEEDASNEYEGTRMMRELADMLGTKVENNTIEYNGKKINFYSETEKFHVDGSKEDFVTPEEVFTYLSGEKNSTTTEEENHEYPYDELEGSEEHEHSEEEHNEEESELDNEEHYEGEGNEDEIGIEDHESFNDRNFRHSNTDEIEETEEIEEGLFSKNDSKIKAAFDKYYAAWKNVYPYYLYLGGDDFVSLKESTNDQKTAAYAIIKEQGKSDKWDGGIGIVQNQHSAGKTMGGKTYYPAFILYKHSSAIPKGGEKDSLIGQSGASKADYTEMQKLSATITPHFETYLKKQGSIKESRVIKNFGEYFSK